MKKLSLLLVLMMLLGIVPARAEETLTFLGVTVEKDATYLDMGDVFIEDLYAFGDFLRELPALEKVDMFATPVTRPVIDAIVENFPNIEFGWTINIAADHYIRTDATAFSTLHGNCGGHSSADFEVLKYCKNLRALDIGHNSVVSLEFLRNLPQLRVLILADNPVYYLTPLEDLKELEYLELFSCNFRDISVLSELPHLMDLNISNNPELYQYNNLLTLTPTLRRLWISNIGSIISEGRYYELQGMYPDATIVCWGEPTDNGWREGEHYETIYEIFHTGEYRPFSDSFPFEEENPTE
ncbi:MAG: hypothetical protein IJS53_01460 [Clostridia bacterium]|nr:hypothetical protein [Clostridia bacterium]